MNLYPVIILAGGLATRLRPITEKIPKALVEVGGEPFIAHQLRLLKSHGVQSVVVSAWYKGEMIREFVRNGEQFGLDVQYVFDGDRPLGTGGAIRQALPLLNGPFFVLYGDSYLPCDYADVQAHFDRHRQPGLMTVYRNHGKWDTSNVEMQDDRILCYDKKNRTPRMEFIDYGLGLFKPEVFAPLPQGHPADLTDVYQKLVADHNLLAFEVRQRFYEVGSFEGLQELDELLRRDPNQFLKGKIMNFTETFIAEATEILSKLDVTAIEGIVDALVKVREQGGRLFILGVGGSAANASHAVNDFRKIVGIETYAPTDNVSELTARTNDEGWASVFQGWLEGSHLRDRDAIMVFSVGGGNLEKNISPNLVLALQFAKEVGAKIVGVVGRDGGYTAQVADACVVIPTIHPDHVTPHTEAFHSVVHHLLVTHPRLKAKQTMWESVK
jgi:D-sedoheptulose 7-phosphate isomerase